MSDAFLTGSLSRSTADTYALPSDDPGSRGCHVGVFELPFDPIRQRFDDRRLREALDGAEIWEMHTQLIDPASASPTWAVIAVYRPGVGGSSLTGVYSGAVKAEGAGAPRSSRKPRQRVDWRATLEGAPLLRYDALRQWRGERARVEQRPAYSVLTNRCMAELARRLPCDVEELLLVPGIGPAKASTYGEQVLQVLATAAEAEG